MRKSLFLIAALAVLSGCESNLQRSNPLDPQSPTNGTVVGFVRDIGGNGLSGATVSADGLSVSAATDANGYFSLKCPAGRRQFTVSKEWYAGYYQEVDVVQSSETRADFALSENLVFAESFEGSFYLFGMPKQANNPPWNSFGTTVLPQVENFASATSAPNDILFDTAVSNSAYITNTFGPLYGALRVQVKIRVDNIASGPGFWINDFSGTRIVSLGLAESAATLRPRYETRAVALTDNFGPSLSVSTFYIYEITVDCNTNRASFTIKDNFSNNTVWQKNDIQVFPAGKVDCAQLGIGIKTVSAAATAHADDIRVWAK